MSILDTLNSVAPALTGLGAIANPLVGIGVGVGSAALNYAMQRKQWQREDSSVQRRVEDLKRAGLNPVLAANGAGEPTSLTTKFGMDVPDLSMSGLSRMQAMQLFDAQRDQAIAAARASIAEAKSKESQAIIDMKMGWQADEIVSNRMYGLIRANQLLDEQIRNTNTQGLILSKDYDNYNANFATGILKNILGGIGIPGLNLLRSR